MITALILTAALAAQPSGVGTTPEGEVGFTTADGTIVTEEAYNDWFSYENLSQVPDLTSWYQGVDVSVAEARNIDPVTPAAERPREFEGERLPTVRQLFEHWRVR